MNVNVTALRTDTVHYFMVGLTPQEVADMAVAADILSPPGTTAIYGGSDYQRKVRARAADLLALFKTEAPA